MSTGDAQPTLTVPDAARRERRPAWPWIVVVVIVAGLAVAAWFAAEWVARAVVENTIRSQAVSTLALPEDQEVEVAVAGAVIPQLIKGTLDHVTVASLDVPVGPTAGDVKVTAEGIAIRGDPVADAASATVALDEAQLQALMATVDGFPAESLGLSDPDVTMSTELQFLGLAFPLGVALTPSAVEGDLVLSPASLQLGDADITAAELRDRFGRLADAVLRDWTVCVAEYIPAGAVLGAVAVDGPLLVADFEIDGGIAADPTLQENGTCP